ncbi:MAG TPA: PAS domain-containing protein, partial [Chitinophagaceae bacterium]|nr:PAS domain-containing protein [Chitinophagaceae bacterium]
MKTNIEKPMLTAIDNSPSVQRVKPEHCFLRTLSEVLSEAVIITDKQLKIEYWNKAASQLFGFTKTDTPGKNISDWVLQDHNTAPFENILQDVAD